MNISELYIMKLQMHLTNLEMVEILEKKMEKEMKLEKEMKVEMELKLEKEMKMEKKMKRKLIKRIRQLTVV